VAGKSTKIPEAIKFTRKDCWMRLPYLSEEKTDGDINNCRFETFPCPLQFMSILYKFLGLKCKEINILEIYKQNFFKEIYKQNFF
jgi:hypothetical protein